MHKYISSYIPIDPYISLYNPIDPYRSPCSGTRVPALTLRTCGGGCGLDGRKVEVTHRPTALHLRDAYNTGVCENNALKLKIYKNTVLPVRAKKETTAALYTDI